MKPTDSKLIIIVFKYAKNNYFCNRFDYLRKFNIIAFAYVYQNNSKHTLSVITQLDCQKVVHNRKALKCKCNRALRWPANMNSSIRLVKFELFKEFYLLCLYNFHFNFIIFKIIYLKKK